MGMGAAAVAGMGLGAAGGAITDVKVDIAADCGVAVALGALSRGVDVAPCPGTLSLILTIWSVDV